MLLVTAIHMISRLQLWCSRTCYQRCLHLSTRKEEIQTLSPFKGNLPFVLYWVKFVKVTCYMKIECPGSVRSVVFRRWDSLVQRVAHKLTLSTFKRETKSVLAILSRVSYIAPVVASKCKRSSHFQFCSLNTMWSVTNIYTNLLPWCNVWNCMKGT